MFWFIILNLGFWQYGTAYFYYEPEFYCQVDRAGNTLPCAQKEACNSNFEYKLKVTRSSIVSLNALYCEKEYIKSDAIFFTFLISGLGSVIFTYLVDYFGRLIFFKIGCFGVVISSFALIFVSNYKPHTVLSCFLGLFLNILNSMVFLQFPELSSGWLRQNSNSFLDRKSVV